MSDHSEFMKAKDEFIQWMKRTSESVQECVGNGDLEWLNDKLKTLNLVAERMTEGKRIIKLFR